MTETEYQDLVNRVLSTLRTNSKEIENLPSVLQLSDNDSFEISNGRKVAFSTLLKHIKGYQPTEGSEDDSTNIGIIQIWKELSNDSNLKIVAFDYMPDRVKNAIEWVEIIKSNDNDNAINKWNEIISFLSEVEATSLNEILSNYATKEQLELLAKNVGTIDGDYIKNTRKIVAGTGLTGGGDLSADRTFSLATVGKSGTYTKVMVDAYGRVTGNSTLLESDIPYLSISKINNLQSTIDTINKNFAYYLPVSGGAMTNTKLVTNLNADLLDGVHLKDVHKSGWVHVTPYSYDTTAVKYYWFKVAQIDYTQEKAGKAVIELLAMGDNNYPYSSSARLRIQNYCDIDDNGNLTSHSSSIMLIADVYNEVHLNATIDKDGGVWVQADNCGVESTLSWRAILEGESDYPNVQILNGTTKQFDTPEGTVIHENESVRYDVLNNTYISYPYNYQIGGSLTIGGANGVTLSFDATNDMLKFSKGGYFLGAVSTKGVSNDTGTGGTGINLTRMWEELASVDATKLIDISHMPSSVKTAVNWVSTITSDDDTDAKIDKWNEIVSFLSGISDTSSLNSILSGKADASVVEELSDDVSALSTHITNILARKISAGTGLTGGGDLSADRTLSLATIGTAGTYTKVVVDAYGRVTGNSTLLESDIPALSIGKITNLQSTINTINANFANYLPLTGGVMKNTNLVTNLNADLLDGVHLADVYRKSGWNRVVPYIYTNETLYYYWFKVAQINYTTAHGLTELEVTAVNDANYMYAASARLTIKGYSGETPSCSVLLASNAYLSTRINVALDKDGGVWVKTNCSWASYLRWRTIVNDENYTGITILNGSTKQLDQPVDSNIIGENKGTTYRKSTDAFETLHATFDVGVGCFRSPTAQVRILPYTNSAYIEFGNPDFTKNVPAYITGYNSSPLDLLTISSHSTIFSGTVTIGGINGVTLSYDATNDMLKFSKGGYFLGAVSTKGVSNDTGTGGTGVDLSAVWESLTNNTDVYGSTKIHIDHIPTLTKSKISDFPTLVSTFANDAGYITASAIINKADKATTLAGYGITDAMPFLNMVNASNLKSIGVGYVNANGANGENGGIISFGSASYQTQIHSDYLGGNIHWRVNSNGTLTSWRNILDSNNYSNYAVTLNTNQTITGLKTFSNGLSATKISGITDSSVVANLHAQYSTNLIADNNRNADELPYGYGSKAVNWRFKENIAIGITDGGSYSGVLHLTPWTDPTGGVDNQLAFTFNGKIKYRSGLSTWGEWIELLTFANGVTLCTDQTITGNKTFRNSGYYAGIFNSTLESGETRLLLMNNNTAKLMLAYDGLGSFLYDYGSAQTLRIQNDGDLLFTKSIIASSQLKSNVATGIAPLVVNSTTMVANLNTNYLGGLNKDSFHKAVYDYVNLSGTANTTALPTVIAPSNYNGINTLGGNFKYYETKFYNTQTNTANRCQLAYGYDVDSIHFRRYKDGAWSAWKTVAFTDSTVANANALSGVTIDALPNYLNTAYKELNLYSYVSGTDPDTGEDIIAYYDPDTWYPCVLQIDSRRPTRIRIWNSLHSSNAGWIPSWGTHTSGFTLNLEWEVVGNAWGATSQQRTIKNYNYSFTSDHLSPCGGIDQNTQQSREVVWLRGGTKYLYKTDNNASFIIYREGYSWSGGSDTYTAPLRYASNSDTAKVIKDPRISRSQSLLAVADMYADKMFLGQSLKSYLQGNGDGSMNLIMNGASRVDIDSYGRFAFYQNIAIRQTSARLTMIRDGYTGLFIGFNSDISSPNRGVYDFNLGEWLVGTNGTQIFLGNKNVGIGTRSPAYKLDVNGTARVTQLMIGEATISWDSVNGMLKFDKGAYFLGPVSTKGVSNGSGLVAVAQFGVEWQDLWNIDNNEVSSYGNVSNASIEQAQGSTNGSSIAIVCDAFAGKNIGDIEIFTLGWEGEPPANVRLAPYQIGGTTLYCSLLLSGTMIPTTFKIKVF